MAVVTCMQIPSGMAKLSLLHSLVLWLQTSLISEICSLQHMPIASLFPRCHVAAQDRNVFNFFNLEMPLSCGFDGVLEQHYILRFLKVNVPASLSLKL